jgi:D-ribulokinase
MSFRLRSFESYFQLLQILWMDHRAKAEAKFINETCTRMAEEKKEQSLLTQVGGAISPEMEPPKILWLKKHLPQAFEKTAKFFDLTDFLTYKSSGDDGEIDSSCVWIFLNLYLSCSKICLHRRL